MPDEKPRRNSRAKSIYFPAEKHEVDGRRSSCRVEVWPPQSHERPYDSMTRAALLRVGPLDWDELVTYVPSPLLGGEEAIANVVKMPARTVMVVNGDLATQLVSEPERDVERLETYVDEFGRTRLRVVWAE